MIPKHIAAIEVKVKVLVEGYARKTKTGWIASSSVVYIEDNRKKIIVDPGINRKLLLDRLKKANLKSGDINYVLLTHYHLDHAYLASIFENAAILDGFTIYENDKETDYQKIIPDTSIQLIPTPGHAYEHHSLFVPTTDKGNVVIAGDIFWFQDSEKQTIDINKNDPFVLDKKALTLSRKKLLKLADWIIPGHGKMFENLR